MDEPRHVLQLVAAVAVATKSPSEFPHFFQALESIVEVTQLVQVGQSFKTVGCGCTSSWGDVGAGDAEADVIYISFIGSVQYIGY